MAYPTTDGPKAVDVPVVRTNLVHTVIGNDFNYHDGQARTIQSWLGWSSGAGCFIGDNGDTSDGPGGMVSPVADGGVAFTFAAHEDYTSGKLASFGDDYDGVYSEKVSIDYAGSIVANALTLTEGIEVGLGAVDDPSVKFTGVVSGFYYDPSHAILATINSVWRMSVGEFYAGFNSGDDGVMEFTLARQSTASHGAGSVAFINFIGRDSEVNSQTYAKVKCEALVVTHGSESGQLTVEVAGGSGPLVDSAVFNIDGVYADPGTYNYTQTVTSSGNQIDVNVRNGFNIRHTLTETTTVQPTTNAQSGMEILFSVRGNGSAALGFTVNEAAQSYSLTASIPSIASTQVFIIAFFLDPALGFWVEKYRSLVTVVIS
jgi:hypothetical protein